MFGIVKLWSQVLNMGQFFCEQVLMQIYGCTYVQSHRSTGAHESRILMLCATVYSTFTPAVFAQMHISVCTDQCLLGLVQKD